MTSSNDAYATTFLTKVACELRDQAEQSGDILIWTICKYPSDYPDRFIARPHSIRNKCGISFILSAFTYEELIKLLPPGLVRQDRHPADDPVILETWF